MRLLLGLQMCLSSCFYQHATNIDRYLGGLNASLDEQASSLLLLVM